MKDETEHEMKESDIYLFDTYQYIHNSEQLARVTGITSENYVVKFRPTTDDTRWADIPEELYKKQQFRKLYRQYVEPPRVGEVWTRTTSGNRYRIVLANSEYVGIMPDNAPDAVVIGTCRTIANLYANFERVRP